MSYEDLPVNLMHKRQCDKIDLKYLATTDTPFDPDDLSDEVQITTIRTHRLYADHPWRVQLVLIQKC